jgi:hypothetical protein
MNRQRLRNDFISDGRIHMAVRLADDIAAKNSEASAYHCAEKAIQVVFGHWLLDHTAAVRPELLPDYFRLVDRVEQSLGLHRRRHSRPLPMKPALGDVPVSDGYTATMSVPLAV